MTFKKQLPMRTYWSLFWHMATV